MTFKDAVTLRYLIGRGNDDEGNLKLVVVGHSRFSEFNLSVQYSQEGVFNAIGCSGWSLGTAFQPVLGLCSTCPAAFSKNRPHADKSLTNCRAFYRTEILAFKSVNPLSVAPCLIASPTRAPNKRNFIVGLLSKNYTRCVFGNSDDSVLEDFLQEISERRPPDEHTMGSGHDGVDMLDVQST